MFDNKTLYCFLISLLWINEASSQQIERSFTPLSPTTTYEAYMKKRNAFNTAGWIMLGTGVVSALYSLQSWVKDDFNGPWDLEPLFLAGSSVAVASVPVFIIAGSYKRKANLALKGETSMPGNRAGRIAYPAVAIQVNF